MVSIEFFVLQLHLSSAPCTEWHSVVNIIWKFSSFGLVGLIQWVNWLPCPCFSILTSNLLDFSTVLRSFLLISDFLQFRRHVCWIGRLRSFQKVKHTNLLPCRLIASFTSWKEPKDHEWYLTWTHEIISQASSLEIFGYHKCPAFWYLHYYHSWKYALYAPGQTLSLGWCYWFSRIQFLKKKNKCKA